MDWQEIMREVKMENSLPVWESLIVITDPAADVTNADNNHEQFANQLDLRFCQDVPDAANVPMNISRKLWVRAKPIIIFPINFHKAPMWGHHSLFRW